MFEWSRLLILLEEKRIFACIFPQWKTRSYGGLGLLKQRYQSKTVGNQKSIKDLLKYGNQNEYVMTLICITT